MGSFQPAPLYPIIDVGPTDRADPLKLVTPLLAAAVPWLQLRVKSWSTGDHLDLSRDLIERATRHGTRVIINDRLDIALASGAGGVHLGQSDLPLELARELAGPDLVIGISTHDVSQARRAEIGRADYIGFGPMFATASKEDALVARTPEEFARVVSAVSLPVIAIGGISEDRAREILEKGAASVAMIGALRSSKDVEALARRVLSLEPSYKS